MVTHPRMHCYKLQIGFDSEDMIKRFLTSMRSGFYFSVIATGEVSAGSKTEVLKRDPHRVTIRDVLQLYLGWTRHRKLLERAVSVTSLP